VSPHVKLRGFDFGTGNSLGQDVLAQLHQLRNKCYIHISKHKNIFQKGLQLTMTWSAQSIFVITILVTIVGNSLQE